MNRKPLKANAQDDDEDDGDNTDNAAHRRQDAVGDAAGEASVMPTRGDAVGSRAPRTTPP